MTSWTSWKGLGEPSILQITLRNHFSQRGPPKLNYRHLLPWSNAGKKMVRSSDPDLTELEFFFFYNHISTVLLATNWTYFWGLSWEALRQVDLHTCQQDLKSLCRGFNWVHSCYQSRSSQQYLTLSRICPWNIPGYGNGEKNIYFKYWERARRLWLLRTSLWDIWQSCPLSDLLQQSKVWVL